MTVWACSCDGDRAEAELPLLDVVIDDGDHSSESQYVVATATVVSGIFIGVVIVGIAAGTVIVVGSVVAIICSCYRRVCCFLWR